MFRYIEYGAKVALLAAVYFLSAKLGLLQATPPSNATLIWPASGIALGALIVYGRRLAPGIFIGAFLFSSDLVAAWLSGTVVPDRLVPAMWFAGGVTAQALAGHALIVRWFGLPLRLARVRDAFRLFAVAGPLTCTISATIGIATWYFFGNITGSMVPRNWLSWWTGDVFGIVVFLPLVLLLPGGPVSIYWRDRALRDMRAIGLTMMVLPLGLTFYAWKFLADSARRESQEHFAALTRDSEQQITARLATYANAVRSGAGVFQSSEFVSRREWQTFAETLRLDSDYPGLLGLGWIERVDPAQADGYLARVRADGAPDFRIHPGEDRATLDVITYIEPESANADEVGLNIGEELRSAQAAERAALSGQPVLSQPTPLVRDGETAPGFFLMQAVYRTDLPLDTPALRRQALRGFVCAPFLAGSFIDHLAPGQSTNFRMSIYDGPVNSTELIAGSRGGIVEPKFSVRRDLELYGQTWSVLWQSTAEFEHAESSPSGEFLLFGGLLFTGLCAVLLVLSGARARAAVRGPLEQPCVLPIATFLLLAGSGVAAYVLLDNAEHAHVGALVEAQARQVEAGLERSVRMRLQALRRMAHRWASGDGTPYAVWRNDARDIVRQIGGLDELQWIAPDYSVHWAEGARRSVWVDNRDIRTSARLTRDLADGVERGAPLVTEPSETADGDSQFVVYEPLLRAGKFDGFLAARFSSREFFKEALDATAGGALAFAVKYAGVTRYDKGELAADGRAWTSASEISIYDKHWTISVSPTQRFIDARHSPLPLIVLLAALLVGALAGILVHFVWIARFKTARLETSARALAESEERATLAMRGMSVGLWDWDITTNALYWSDRFKDLMGVAPGEFTAHYNEFASRVHPEDEAAVFMALHGHLKRRTPYDIEFRMRRNDGEYLWVQVCGQAKYDADGHALRMVGSLQDISAKHRQREAMSSSEAQLRLLVENTPAAVAMFDQDMRYMLTSRRWIEDYRLESRDVIGQSHYEVFPEIGAMPHWIDIHRRALRGERFDVREDTWTREDGQVEHNRWAIHPWHNSKGEVGGIVMFTEVITAQKMSEAALRRSEAMNRAAMDKAPIGYALVKPDGRFLKVNPALCRMLGYSEDELLALDFQAITHPEDLDADLASLKALLGGKIVSYQMDKRYFHRDGRLIWAQLNVSLVRRASGEVDFLVSQVQDITERKAMDSMKDEFVWVVSQELCAPLGVIRESLDRIAERRDLELPQAVRELLDVSRVNSERLATFVQEIQDLDRISAGRMPYELQDASVATLTRQAVAANEVRAARLGVRIALAQIDPSVIFYVDPARYVQALTELLTNAVKFSPPNRDIEVGAELRDGWVRVQVRDHGAGIAEEFRARIFGRFAQAEKRHALPQEGAGLGLHITRQLIEQMGGNIGFVTQVGSGTTFWVEFPIVGREEAIAGLC